MAIHNPGSDEERADAQRSWDTIQSTMDQARSSMYVAGSATILLLWGVISALGFFGMYMTGQFAPEFADQNPWFPAPIWGFLAIAGMIGSALIGHRAGSSNVAGKSSRYAGLRVFFYWLAVTVTAFLLPAAAGLWNADTNGHEIARVAIGVVTLGYVLFGIMHRPAIAVIGAAIAAAYYAPSYLAGDLSLPISAVAIFIVATAGSLWIRKSGVL